MNVIFYNYNKENNRLNKEPYLTNGVTINCDFNISYDVIRPTIKIEYENMFNFNYCFVEDLNKYYFIENITIERKNLFICECVEDVLYTFKDTILNSKGIVNQSSNSLYLNGVNIPTYSNTKLVKYDFNDNFNHDGVYVLISSGYIQTN